MEEPQAVVINMCDSVQFASKAVIKKKTILLYWSALSHGWVSR